MKISNSDMDHAMRIRSSDKVVAQTLLWLQHSRFSVCSAYIKLITTVHHKFYLVARRRLSAVEQD